MRTVALESLLLLSVFLLSLTGTWVLYRHVLNRRIIDIPSARSSHTRPTPRGGGLAVVVSFLMAVLVLFASGRMPDDLFLAISGGGVLVAAIGFWDDRRDVSAGVRIVVHFAAAGWVLWWLSGVQPLPVGKWVLDLGWLGNGLALVFLVWLLNLYNFMDGIDGIAGVEAVSVAGGAALILLGKGEGAGALAPALLVASCAGFLCWNWPPAKIFMGDVGSGFLGLVLGILAIHTTNAGLLPVWSWLILLGVFFADATLTLLRRVVHGDKWYEAHRTHAYQHAARRWQSHKKVTLATAAITLCWLLPLAWVAAVRQEAGWWLTVVSYVPLGYLAWRLGAGRTEGVFDKAS
jgi:Fuc2NAc and GlcNAc transferase